MQGEEQAADRRGDRRGENEAEDEENERNAGQIERKVMQVPGQRSQSPYVAVEPEAEARQRAVVADRQTIRSGCAGCKWTGEKRQGRRVGDLGVIDDQTQVIAAETVPQRRQGTGERDEQDSGQENRGLPPENAPG